MREHVAAADVVVVVVAAAGAGKAASMASAAIVDEGGETPRRASPSVAGSWPSLRPEAKGCYCAGTSSLAEAAASKVVGPVALVLAAFGQPEAGRRLRSSGNIASSASNTSRLPPVIIKPSSFLILPRFKPRSQMSFNIGTIDVALQLCPSDEPSMKNWR